MTEPIEPVKAWYVAENDLKTSRTRIPIREGETLTLDDPQYPKLCAFGYHASVRLLDAFRYRTYGVICLVEVSGDVAVSDDKIAGRSRKTLRIIPQEVSEKVCREFTCDVAERMLFAEREAGREPAPESFKAIAVARDFAAGKATEEELRTAWTSAAAKAAAWAAWAAWAAAAVAAAARAGAWAAAARAAVEAAVMAGGSTRHHELSVELENRLLTATEKT